MKTELLALLSVEFASPVPIYEQIKRRIKQALAQGALLPGEEIPSIRELAAYLKINPNTVVRAFRELSQEGVIEGRAGKGFWVSAGGQGGDETKLQLLRDDLLRVLEKAAAMGVPARSLRLMLDEFFREET